MNKILVITNWRSDKWPLCKTSDNRMNADYLDNEFLRESESWLLNIDDKTIESKGHAFTKKVNAC